MDLRVIGDIGGTNARFALAQGGTFSHLATLGTRDHESFDSALAAYLGQLPAGIRPQAGAFAVAGPVAAGQARLTNLGWTIAAPMVAAAFGLRQVVVVNDFAGAALGVPFLPAGGVHPIGPAKAKKSAGGPIGLIGPGTGLGVGAIMPAGTGWLSLPGEGGHATMAAATQRESDVLGQLRAQWPHLSAERVLSGPGLVNLYGAIQALAGQPAQALSPADVSQRAMDGTDAACAEAFAVFCAMLGTVAANLALTLGATGGVYIAGGILPRYRDAFAASGFRARFEDKGRLRDYMAAIPTGLVVDGALALRGLANLPLAAA